MTSILLADDDANAIRILRRRLESASYAVEAAPNGAVALELLRERDFDVLITDINMPQMDGEQLYAALREQLPERDPLVFVLTGRPGEGHRRWVSDQEGIEFIEKPVSLRHLLERLVERLAGREQKDGGGP